MAFVCNYFRLEAYDRNSNFGYSPADDQPVYSMVLPDPSAYKDINKDMKVSVIRFV